MNHHVSFGVREPHRVAQALAELTHAAAVRARWRTRYTRLPPGGIDAEVKGTIDYAAEL